jgi:hypothetical protein
MVVRMSVQQKRDDRKTYQLIIKSGGRTVAIPYVEAKSRHHAEQWGEDEYHGHVFATFEREPNDQRKIHEA